MKLLDEVIEKPFDIGRFKKFAGLMFGDPEQSGTMVSGPERSDLEQSVPARTSLEQSGFCGLAYCGGVTFIKWYACSDDTKIAILAVNSGIFENAALCKNGVMQGMSLSVLEKNLERILDAVQCEAAVAAFYEDAVPEWRLSFIRRMQHSRQADVIRLYNCSISRTSFIMGVGGGSGALALTGIANTAARRQLMKLGRRKGQLSLEDVEKAFSYRVFTRNIVRDFKRQYPDIAELSDIVRLPGFKMSESGPYDRELAIDPEMLGNIFENRSDRKNRRNSGAFYTPSEIVSFMCREGLAEYISNATGLPCEDCRAIPGFDGPECLTKAEFLQKVDRALQQVRIYDPAAGSGAFVLGMLKEIVRLRRAILAYISPSGANAYHIYTLMLHAIRECIFAADIDEEAVRLTKLRLQCALYSARSGRLPFSGGLTGSAGFKTIPKSPESSLFCNIICGDSLDDNADILKNSPAFARVISEKRGFDIIIGNPPYISAVEGARNGNLLRNSLKAKYTMLKGSFDIYTAFLLEGVRKTNREGVYCWIVPNSLLSSRYALPVLEHLRQNGLKRSISVSDIDIFHNVGIYPVIAVGNKRASGKAYSEYMAASAENPGFAAVRSSPGHAKYGTFKDYGIRIASGAAGFQAGALARCIAEECRDAAIPFVVSGSIDKYFTRFKNVRYMGKTYIRAFITKNGEIAQSKWRLWCEEKIIVAGLTRELEADYSREPLALGVGTYAIYDFAGFDPLFLLGLLNSSFMSQYLRDQFYEKHLAGGYLSISKTTLEQLPMVPVNPEIQKTVAKKARAAKTLMHKLQGERAEAEDAQTEKALQLKLMYEKLLADIDKIVDELFTYHHFR